MPDNDAVANALAYDPYAEEVSDLQRQLHARQDREGREALARLFMTAMAPFAAVSRNALSANAIRPEAGRPIEQNVRLYRGEPANPGGDPARAGSWWSRSEEKARGFAGKDGHLYYVDVPIKRMGEVRWRGGGDATLSKELQGDRVKIYGLAQPALINALAGDEFAP